MEECIWIFTSYYYLPVNDAILSARVVLGGEDPHLLNWVSRASSTDIFSVTGWGYFYKRKLHNNFKIPIVFTRANGKQPTKCGRNGVGVHYDTKSKNDDAQKRPRAPYRNGWEVKPNKKIQESGPLCWHRGWWAKAVSYKRGPVIKRKRDFKENTILLFSLLASPNQGREKYFLPFFSD